MKRTLLILAALLLICSMVQAEIMPPGITRQAIETEQGKPVTRTRNVPEYTFTKTPYPIIVNYFDYMIGSYNGLPLRVIPDSEGGGYFMTYHGRRQANATRRVFYAYLSPTGDVINNSEITIAQNHEGFPTLVVDPISGKPFYAWHANADDDDELEVEFVSDAFMSGLPELWNEIQLIADNPTTVIAPNDVETTDNEFIWPTATIGPSPVDGKRRLYVSMRNSESHAMDGNPSENVLLVFTDVDADMIEMGDELIWQTTSVPDYDLWNQDTDEFRRPFTTLAVDDAGNLYYIGNLVTRGADDNSLDEDEFIVHICDNYGEGTWTMLSSPDTLPVWNPPEEPGSNVGYFQNDANEPYGPGEINWSIIQAGHSNAVTDNYGRVIFPGVWGLTTNENTYYPAMQMVKYAIFDPATRGFQFKEVWPKKDPNNDAYEYYHPWDNEEPWGEPEYIESSGEYYLDIATVWPYPHWDTSAHDDAMMFHYNNIKVSKPNDEGMMVMVWQDCQRARWFNEYSDTDFEDFANTPEIYIAVSDDNGDTWSDPIVLNNVETPEFAGIKPMYVYPADKVHYMGIQDGHRVGKIGFMFYNDYTWGSNVNSPAYHSNPDGGEVMFMEMQIKFSSTGTDNHVVTPAPSILHPNYPNPFNPSTTISFDMPRTAHASLKIYNVKGQLVRSLLNDTRSFGRHSVVWDGKDERGSTVPSGLYFYRLQTDNHVETRKMMLMK